MIPNGGSGLRVAIETNGFNVPADERTRMHGALAPLEDELRPFPNSELRVKVIHHPRSNSYHVEFKLAVPGGSLATADVDPYLDTAFQRGLRKLIRKAIDYRDNADGPAKVAQRQADRNLAVVAPEDPETGPLAETVQAGDYRAFRASLGVYEEWLRKRIGRWVQRYPEAESRIGGALKLGDLVEEVYLNAFEHFGARPTAVRLTEWLEGLIDPSLKALLRHPDEERENASLARTWRDAGMQ